MNTLRITPEAFSELKKNLFKDAPKESAVYLIGGFFENNEGSHFVVRELRIPRREDYDAQETNHIQISPIFFNKVIKRAEGEGLAVVLCHSHPWSGKLVYSPSDDYGERVSSKTLYQCLLGKPTGSLLFGKGSIIGRIWIAPDQPPIPIHQLRLVGRHLNFNYLEKQKKKNAIEKIYSRQILAFGETGQEFLSNLRVGIIGLGGTGSCIAEQLVRIGVRDFFLVDKDGFEPSNRTRLYGSDSKTKNEKKTIIVSENIKRINPKATVEVFPKDVINQQILEQLKNCDIVFSCTDRHAPRAVVNELCYQYFIPVIDVGVGLDSDSKKITGATVRATLTSPGLPCLLCSGIINPETIATEYMTEDEKKKRAVEGYISNFQTNEPSVISFTTTAAGMGVNIFLDLLFGYMQIKSSNLLLDVATFESIRIGGEPSECVCRTRLARGDYMALSAPYDEVRVSKKIKGDW